MCVPKVAIVIFVVLLFPTKAFSALPSFPMFSWIPVSGFQTYSSSWPTVAGYDRYQVYVDGKPGSIQPAYPGDTQGFTIPLPCDGLRHRANVRGGVTVGSTIQWGPFHKNALGKDDPYYFVTPPPLSATCGR